MKKFILTIDTEQDISSKLKNSYKGIDKLPLFLDLLKRMNIKACFFITADVCKRYPDTMKRLVEDGHEIGCHGYNHKELWFKTYNQQLKEIKKSTDIIHSILGVSPKMFRAPRFSVTKRTIKALEDLGYIIDSSILPNSVVKEYKGLITCHSHIGGPIQPYHPSRKNILEIGNSTIVEVPLSENPLLEGAPIGAGFLNKFGLSKTLEAIQQVKTDYVMFLIHPWELVDLFDYYPDLDSWITEICSGNLELYEELFSLMKKTHQFCTLEDLI